MTTMSQHPRALLRSAAAVFLGLLAGVVLSLGTDRVAGSYIAARLAPDRPMQHALALGVVGLAVSIAGTVATWGRGPAFGPAWYSLAIIALAMPCAWAGGRLRDLQLRTR